MMNQREAVFKAVTSVVGDVNGKVELDTDQKKAVIETLIMLFTTGQVELKGNRSPDYIRKYVPGLLNNWLRKDKALNGGTKYETKKPGSRAGSGDETMKAMRTLLAATTDPAARSEIEQAIEARKLELKPKVEINIEALPPALRRLAPAANS